MGENKQIFVVFVKKQISLRYGGASPTFLLVFGIVTNAKNGYVLPNSEPDAPPYLSEDLSFQEYVYFPRWCQT